MIRWTSFPIKLQAFEFAAFERSREGVLDDSCLSCGEVLAVTAAEGNTPRKIVRNSNSRVVEHLDTKSATNSASSLEGTAGILQKWRPPGRPNNLRAAERTVLDVLR